MEMSQSAEPVAADAAAEQTMAAQYMDDLQDSLGRLGRLATGLLSLEDSLTQVADYAVRAIPGAEGAGLTLLEENRSDTIVSTADFVAQIDDIQYSLGQARALAPWPIEGSCYQVPWAVTAVGRSSDLAWHAWACTVSCR